MYSRYMRSGGLWEDEDPPARPPLPGFAKTPPVAPAAAAPVVPTADHTPRGGTGGGLSSLFRNLDISDLLLLAIILFLVLEGGDLELVLTLVLLVMGGL